MRVTKRTLQRIIREETRRMRRLVHEMHGDWGMGAEEESRTHPGEKDYTGHTGDESRTQPGELDYEGGDVEHKAMTAMKAIHDLASAAGVELQTDISGPSELVPEEPASEELALAVENRRRLKRLIRKVAIENNRRARRRCR